MTGTFHRTAFLVLLTAVLAMMAAASADAAVLKNKQTGEQIRGTLTDQKISGLTLFNLEGGGTKFLNMNDWEIIEADAPAKKTEDATGTATDDDQKQDDSGKSAKKCRVYVIPIEGAIQSMALAAAVKRGLDEAKKWKADVVVFRMDTPGGALHVANDIVDSIQGVDWATVVAWIQGKEDRALSAGTFISLACQSIYMAPGTTIGAATPYRMVQGSAEVDEKMQSAFRAQFRALSEKRELPAALADAMVDSSTSVIQVFVNGQQKLVSEEEAKQLAEEHKGDGAFRRGKTVSQTGKILTMTANEALEYKLIKGLAADIPSLMEVMDIDNYQAREADWLTDWVAKTTKDNKEKFEKLRADFNGSWKLAQQSDPLMNGVSLSDGGRRWREYSNTCLKHLKKCADVLKQIEAMSNDESSDIRVQQEAINNWKTELETLYKRVNADRNRSAP
ncbi:MAG: hypothetical protein JXL80_00065 [Planctomycetes bacterium]|nr:hypothetical protein [Planctomycetota bacterium]